MNPFGWLKPLGKWLKKAVNFVHEHLTDEVIELAVGWVIVARDTITDNDARREFVLKMLMAKGIPESIARAAIEIAVGIIKNQKNS